MRSKLLMGLNWHAFLRIMTAGTFSAILAFPCHGQAPKTPPKKGPLPPEGQRTYARPPDIENVRYGLHERNVLDLWQAKADKPTPIVVFFHPGGFTHGDKRGERTGLSPKLLDICLARGISVATANYRLSKHAPFPAPHEDCARAIQFLRHRAKEWNLNPKALASTGASAGAAISMWLAFKPDFADPNNADPVKRQSTRPAVIGCIDGQSSLDPRVIVKLVNEATIQKAGPQALAPLFGLPRDADFLKVERAFPFYEEASAINHLKPGAPPAFLYYSRAPGPLTEADIHSVRFGVIVKEPMDKLGIDCVLRHAGDYAGPDRGTAMNRDMVEFILKHLPREQ